MASEPEIVILSSSSLPKQPWAKALHSSIIEAFQREDIQAFPPSWTRLDPNPAIGISRLAEELGPYGYLAVVLADGEPVGCGGFLPCRGNDWINKEKKADNTPEDVKTSQSGANVDKPRHVFTEWEICCFCIHPRHRKLGLSKALLNAMETSIRKNGGKRLATNFSKVETGYYWPRLGFEPVPGATSILKKGFTHTVGMEGLREDLHFQVAMKELQ